MDRGEGAPRRDAEAEGINSIIIDLFDEAEPSVEDSGSKSTDKDLEAAKEARRNENENYKQNDKLRVQ